MKKIIEYSALIYAFLIFIGYSYIDIYYDLFGISIYSYLDASEILLSFLNRITFLVFLFLAFVMYASVLYIIVNLSTKIKNKYRSKSPKISEETVEHKLMDKFARYLGISGVFILSIYTIYRITQKIIFGTFDDKVILSTVLILALLAYLYYKLPILFKKFSLRNRRLIFLILVACFLNFITSIIKYNRVVKNIERVQFSFDYNTKTYKTCDSLRYIGSTSKYVFISNLIQGDNYVFPKDELKNYRIINLTKVK